MKLFKRLNVFTFLIVAAGLAFMFRLVNIATFSAQDRSGIHAIMPAAAVENADDASDEQPPPLDKAALEKGVAQTAKDVEEGGSEVEASGKDSIKPPSVPAPPQGERAFSAAEIEVLQTLAKRRDELEKRERVQAERDALLKAAEQEVDRKIAELNKLKGEIEALLGQQETMEESRIVSLVKIYEGMKPKEAATIFNTLDMDVLLAVISRMNERKSSPVLANMDPEKARIVTIRLAEQRKLPVGGKAPAAATAEQAAPAPAGAGNAQP